MLQGIWMVNTRPTTNKSKLAVVHGVDEVTRLIPHNEVGIYYGVSVRHPLGNHLAMRDKAQDRSKSKV